MLSLFKPFGSVKYHVLRNERTPPYHCSSLKVWCQLTAICFLSLGVGYLGMLTERHTASFGEKDLAGLLVPYGDKVEIWHHDLNFSSPPTPESEAAWSALIPVGRGFIYHPDVAPEASSISVFHQLHCLHGLRVAFYGMKHELDVIKDSAIVDAYIQEQAARVHVGHLQHCFDYLRRVLMCAADTNLEHLDPKTDATTGWGSERICRDFQSVKNVAESWKNSTDFGIN